MAGKHEPILVVGGGLGGAAAALALGRKGLRVRVLEQAQEFGVIGYGIQLGPNVFPMFDRLGVSDAVLAQAIVPKAVLMVDSVDGGVIARIPTGESFQRALQAALCRHPSRRPARRAARCLPGAAERRTDALAATSRRSRSAATACGCAPRTTAPSKARR